ncbi:predicted protein [Naegleria gruberi]|uniref:Predicted protein n=1 Tax=Naegleria gruberi TaxID=5762 RepID=D2VZY7_NAEGR|nr:uncharacterized protein NAEGRDRAFT_53615 [Naegleria gruberi]EFC37651.1 predicted protein [Naegleria gruberi]|eukprot:XP_002670395.1 predicted protein [Naegleria gruberi strain NEG-M]
MMEHKVGKYKINQEEIVALFQQEPLKKIEKNLNQIPGLFGLEIDDDKYLTFWNAWFNQEEYKFMLPQSKSDLIFVCIMHGGHFSGAIFDPSLGKAIVHKTFSNYVSRKKQGGRQLQHDIQTGHKAKSAGSEIRRNQEVKFQEKLTELLTETWKKYFDGEGQQKVYCSFVYCPGNINRDMIEQLLWNEMDLKSLPIRNIPFQVPKPNFMNLISCYDKLCTVHITSKDRISELTNDDSTLLSNLEISDEESSEDDLEKTKEQLLNDEYLKNYPSPLSPQSATFSSPVHSPRSPLSPILQALGFNIEPSQPLPKKNQIPPKMTNAMTIGQPLLSNKRKKNKKQEEWKPPANDSLINQSLAIWGVILAVAAATLTIYIWKFADHDEQ